MPLYPEVCTEPSRQVNETVRKRFATLVAFETQVDFRIERYRCEAQSD